MNGAVILAAGSSSRMGTGVKKEFMTYKGKPLLYYGVKTFLDSSLFSSLVVVCKKDLMDETKSILNDFEEVEFIAGGDTRQQSVLNSLEYLKDRGLESILIHDGARPFVSCETITAVHHGVCEHGACIPIEPSTNAMKVINHKGFITDHLEREFTWSAQTPQGFQFNPLLLAHRQAQKETFLFIDDSEIWQKYVSPVSTVQGNRENKKITYPSDLMALGIDIRGGKI